MSDLDRSMHIYLWVYAYISMGLGRSQLIHKRVTHTLKIRHVNYHKLKIQNLLTLQYSCVFVQATVFVQPVKVTDIKGPWPEKLIVNIIGRSFFLYNLAILDLF